MATSRGATATKRSEAATVKAGDRTGRTVGEAAKIEKESPQRTPKAATVANATAGQTLSEPKRAQPSAAEPTPSSSSAKPEPKLSSSKPAPSVPTVVKAAPVLPASPPKVEPKRRESKPKPELCKKFLAGRCIKKSCPYIHESSESPAVVTFELLSDLSLSQLPAFRRFTFRAHEASHRTC
ncbi:hypothetical protein C8Q72DRAFT_342785 [Fomitopsis betulina]|nr:hypothetical protein C8Q72DRAFT_342785 [Fomitopsis betulina]